MLIPFIDLKAQYTLVIENRNEVSKNLKDSGIPTAVHYPIPLHKQLAYKNFVKPASDLSSAEYAAQHVLSLPMSLYLTFENQSVIASSLKGILGRQNPDFVMRS